MFKNYETSGNHKMLLKNRVVAATGQAEPIVGFGLFVPQSMTKKNSCQAHYQPPHGSVKSESNVRR